MTTGGGRALFLTDGAKHAIAMEHYMKRIALFAAVLTLAACSAKEATPAVDSAAMAPAAAAPAMASDSAMKADSMKKDTMMMKDTTKKM